MIGADGLQIANEALVSAAIVLGGAWTLYKFGLQRGLESYIRLELDVTDRRIAGQHSDLILKVRAHNIGSTGVGQQLAWLEVSNLLCSFTESDNIRTAWLPLNPNPRRIIIFGKHAYLEPGEDFIETLLLQVPSSSPYILVRAIFSGMKPGQTWHTQTVYYVGE